jgi:hypothetical protein
MNGPLHILAEDDFGKIVFGVIAVIIWGISALTSWASKQQKEAKRRRLEEIDRRTAGMPPAVPLAPRQIAEGLAARHPEVLRPPADAPYAVIAPPRQAPARPLPSRPLPMPVPARVATPQRRVAIPPRTVMQRPMPPKPARKPLGRGRQKPVDEPMLELEEEVQTPHLQRPAAAPSTPTAPRVPLATASTIRQWLRPQTLQSQFILTELLQPPVGLREPRQ